MKTWWRILEEFEVFWTHSRGPRPKTLDCSKWVKWRSALCFKHNTINTSVKGYSVPECINRAFYQRALCIVLDTLVEHLHITHLPLAKSQECAIKFTPTCERENVGFVAFLSAVTLKRVKNCTDSLPPVRFQCAGQHDSFHKNTTTPSIKVANCIKLLKSCF